MRTCVKFRKIDFSVRTRAYEKRLTGKQPLVIVFSKQTLEIWEQVKSFFMRNLEHWISI